MLFVMTAVDKTDPPGLRLAARPAHIEHLKRLGTKIALAGPFLAADGATPIGSLIIVEAADQAEAEAMLAEDPYVKTGLFSSMTVSPFRLVIQHLPEVSI